MPNPKPESAAKSTLRVDQSFLKGLAVIQAMALRDGSSGVTELADTLGLGKSNVHRLLQTLIHAGFVKRLEDSRYGLTVKLWELGARVHSQLDLRTEALPFMDRLAQQTQETVHLSVLDGIDVLYIEKIDSPQPVRAYTAVGGRAPAANVATGKAMLAWAPADIIRQAGDALAPHAPLSIATADELAEALARIRQNGHAINRGEWRQQVAGLAAPVRDVHGSVVGAVGISGPTNRLTDAVMTRHAPVVMEMADHISARLGYRAT